MWSRDIPRVLCAESGRKVERVEGRFNCPKIEYPFYVESSEIEYIAMHTVMIEWLQYIMLTPCPQNFSLVINKFKCFNNEHSSNSCCQTPSIPNIPKSKNKNLLNITTTFYHDNNKMLPWQQHVTMTTKNMSPWQQHVSIITTSCQLLPWQQQHTTMMTRIPRQIYDRDSDGDGVRDLQDDCPNNPNLTSINFTRHSIEQLSYGWGDNMRHWQSYIYSRQSYKWVLDEV